MDIKYHFDESEISGISMHSGDFCNEITINYAYDAEEQRYKSSITKHNPVSKILYGDAQKIQDMAMLQTTRMAEKIADKILLTSSIPELRISFAHDLRSILLEVGDLFQLQHRAAIGGTVFGTITRKTIQKEKIIYEASLITSDSLYASELITLTQTTPAGSRGITITYDKGVATITVYADVQGYPPVEGAEVTISGNKKITDKNGQVRFNLIPGTYTAYLEASGYEKTEVTFTV